MIQISEELQSYSFQRAILVFPRGKTLPSQENSEISPYYVSFLTQKNFAIDNRIIWYIAFFTFRVENNSNKMGMKRFQNTRIYMHNLN